MLIAFKHLVFAKKTFSIQQMGQTLSPAKRKGLKWISGSGRSGPYVDIAQKACTLLPKAELQVIPGVGHVPSLRRRGSYAGGDSGGEVLPFWVL